MADIVYQSEPLSWEPAGQSAMPIGSDVDLSQVDWRAVSSTLPFLARMQAQRKEAETAAKRYAGQQKLQQNLASGMSFLESLTDAAPLLYADQPAAMVALAREKERQSAAAKQYGELTKEEIVPGVLGVYRKGSPGLHVVSTLTKKPELSESAKMTLNKSALQMQQKEAQLVEMDENRLSSPEHRAVTNWIATVFDKYPMGTPSAKAETAPPAAAPTNALPSGHTLTPEKAMEFLRQAGGDKTKARKLARDSGFSF